MPAARRLFDCARNSPGAPYSESPTTGCPSDDMMYANLVRAPGLDLHFQQRKLAVRRIDLSLHDVMSHGITTRRIRG